jgi:hypothetical protein
VGWAIALAEDGFLTVISVLGGSEGISPESFAAARGGAGLTTSRLIKEVEDGDRSARHGAIHHKAIAAFASRAADST